MIPRKILAILTSAPDNWAIPRTVLPVRLRVNVVMCASAMEVLGCVGDYGLDCLIVDARHLPESICRLQELLNFLPQTPVIEVRLPDKPTYLPVQHALMDGADLVPRLIAVVQSSLARKRGPRSADPLPGRTPSPEAA